MAGGKWKMSCGRGRKGGGQGGGERKRGSELERVESKERGWR